MSPLLGEGKAQAPVLGASGAQGLPLCPGGKQRQVQGPPHLPRRAPQADSQATGLLQGAPTHGPLASPSAADVKFISNPPSMVAAGSVVAAVQGLHLGSSSSFLSYHRLTRFLSKVIRCDPVSGPAPLPCRQVEGACLVSSTRHPSAWGANGGFFGRCRGP